MSKKCPDRNDIKNKLRFWVEHLVAKVTDPKDYISRDKRIEGHLDSMADDISNLYGTGYSPEKADTKPITPGEFSGKPETLEGAIYKKCISGTGGNPLWHYTSEVVAKELASAIKEWLKQKGIKID